MAEQYFSFTGTVVSAPEGSLCAAWLRDWEAEQRQRWIDDDGDRPSWELERDAIAALLWEWMEDAELYASEGGVEQAVWAREDGSAIMAVACPAGGWAEIGAVAWPLQYTAPAAIAGACCAPRYGLGTTD